MTQDKKYHQGEMSDSTQELGASKLLPIEVRVQLVIRAVGDAHGRTAMGLAILNLARKNGYSHEEKERALEAGLTVCRDALEFKKVSAETIQQYLKFIELEFRKEMQRQEIVDALK